MPRIIIIIFTCIIFLEGCKSPLEKFIFTPLTTQELDKIVAQDKSFLHTYAIIEEKNNYVFTKNDSLRFQGITYLRLHNYIKEFSNKKNNALITSNARENWLYRYNRYNSQVDSVINFWENHIKANSPDSVCNINYLGHKIEKVRIANKITSNIRLKFKIKAPKFNIDSLFVKYTISDSITIKSDSNKIFTSIPFEYRRIIRDSIITSIIFNPDLDSIRFDSIFNNNTTKVNFDIISVYKGAKCYNRDSIRKEIPINVLTIIDNKNNTENPYFDETIYRDLIIREQINPNFSSQEATVKNSIESYYKVLDTLVYSYIHYNRL